MKTLSIVSLALGVFALTSISTTANDFTGPVVSVLDGDTIEALHTTHPEGVRLSGLTVGEG